MSCEYCWEPGEPGGFCTSRIEVERWALGAIQTHHAFQSSEESPIQVEAWVLSFRTKVEAEDKLALANGG